MVGSAGCKPTQCHTVAGGQSGVQGGRGTVTGVGAILNLRSGGFVRSPGNGGTCAGNVASHDGRQNRWRSIGNCFADFVGIAALVPGCVISRYSKKIGIPFSKVVYYVLRS